MHPHAHSGGGAGGLLRNKPLCLACAVIVVLVWFTTLRGGGGGDGAHAFGGSDEVSGRSAVAGASTREAITREVNAAIVDEVARLRVQLAGSGGAGAAGPWPPVASLSPQAKKRILVTGGAGFVGSNLVDKLMGFDAVAKNYYFPGWHQPAGFIEFYMNKDKWEALTDAQRTAIEVSCADADLYAMGVAAGAQGEALEEFRANGVNVQRFPDSVLDALRKAADEVYAEESAKNAMFKRVIDSYRAYAASYNEYQALSDLN